MPHHPPNSSLSTGCACTCATPVPGMVRRSSCCMGSAPACTPGSRGRQALSDKYRVVRYDLPGFGLTGADPTGDYADRRGMQVLADLMDALSIRRAALIGNSMGGKLAWMFAADRPQRVTKLILVSPDGFASPGFEDGKKTEVPLLVRLLPYTLPTFMVRMNLAPAYGDPAALTDDLLTRYRDMMLAPGVRDAMIARLAQVELQPPEIVTCTHPGADPAGVGREGRDDPGRQRARLHERLAAQPGRDIPRSRPSAAGGGTGQVACPGPRVP